MIPTNYDQTALDRLSQQGFQNVAKPVPQRLIVKAAGPEKTGKTHLYCTAPEPIIVFSIDIGTEGVVEKFQGNGRKIYVYDIQYKKGGLASDYKQLWTKIDQLLDEAIRVGEGTIVFDSWTEMYELARLNHFAGRLDKVMPGEYPVVYSDLREKIRRIYESRMSAFLVTKMAKGFESKDLEEKGFGDTGFLVQANLTTSRVEAVTDPTTGQVESIFRVAIKDNRQNAKLNGQTFSSHDVNAEGVRVDNFNFSYLVWLTHNWK